MGMDWEHALDTSGNALGEVYEDAVADVMYRRERPGPDGQQLWSPAPLEPEISHGTAESF